MHHELLVPLLPATLVLALIGCAHEPLAVDYLAPADAVAAVDTNRARLDALEVFESGELLWDLSEFTGNCYGMPCDGFDYGAASDAEQAESAVRLAALADLAEQVAADPPRGRAFDRAAVDADVARLEALEIVDVTAFIETEPVYTGNCYGPCPEEQADAERINADRAALLAAIVDEAEIVLGPEPE